MRRTGWKSLDDETKAADARLRRIAVVLAVLIVAAAALAVWTLFIYQPAVAAVPPPVASANPLGTGATTPVSAASPTGAMPTAARATATLPPAGTPARTSLPSAPAVTATSPLATAGTRAAVTPTLAVTTVGTVAPSPQPVRVSSPDYGMHIFGWWRPEVADRDMGLVQAAGFTWIKQLFAWVDIEGAGKGVFDWSRTDRIVQQAEYYKLKILVRVDTTPGWAKGTKGPMADFSDFGDFLAALAARYRGKIAAYEIWNEPNLAFEWGGQPPDPGAYTTMLKTVYPRIKAADPAALVVSAGMSPTTTWGVQAMPDTEFIKNMYLSGAAAYFDVMGVHAAGFKAPPEADPGAVANDPVLGNPGDNSPVALKRVYCFRHVEDVRQIMVDSKDGAKRVFVLEFGWDSDDRPNSPYQWHYVTEEQKADYLVRAFQWAKAHWQPWIGMMTVIYIANIDWTTNDEQFYWAITDPSYPIAKVRPAYTALKEMPK